MMSPARTMRPGALIRAPLTRTKPAAAKAAAAERVRTRRACQSHRSRRWRSCAVVEILSQWRMIFSENRVPPPDQARGKLFPNHALSALFGFRLELSLKRRELGEWRIRVRRLLAPFRVSFLAPLLPFWPFVARRMVGRPVAFAAWPVEALIAPLPATMAGMAFGLGGVGRRRLIGGLLSRRRQFGWRGGSGPIRRDGSSGAVRRCVPRVMLAGMAMPALRTAPAFGPARAPHLDHLRFARDRHRRITRLHGSLCGDRRS